jgi:hypothetical protein
MIPLGLIPFGSIEPCQPPLTKGIRVAYVIIGVVLLLIIAPIISVLPSARQKARMVMRQAAMAAGVAVELTSIDDPNPKQDKYIGNTGKAIPPVLKVVGYRLQRKRVRDWRQLPVVEWALERDLERQWHWQSDPGDSMSPELRSWLQARTQELPDDVERVEEQSYNIRVYWHEAKAGDEVVVVGFLKDCAQIPLHPIGDEMDADGTVE